MVTIRVSDKPFLQHDVKAFVLCLNENFNFDNELLQLEKQFFPGLRAIMEEQGFKGKVSDILVVPVSSNSTVVHLMFAGLGKRDHEGYIPVENYRRAVGHIIKALVKHKCLSVAMQLPSAELFGVKPDYLASQTSCISSMAAYHFDEFITNPTRKEQGDIVINLVTRNDFKEITKGIENGNTISHAVNTARHWVDLPPCNLTPVELAEKAKEIAHKQNLKVTIFNEDEVTQMGMGGLSAVARGSERECQFVIIEYNAAEKNVPTLGFVGKGITFDSGGLSLKTAQHMETMKEDMAGAASVLSAIHAIAVLKPAINVIAIAPLAENLPSDKSLKPGDIIQFYNGKTAEVKNTDAEGRLILADALAYAVKHYDLDALVDIATLTGSCMHALGPFFSGLLSQNESLVENIYEASRISGERVWRLPLDDDYKPAIKSDVADMCNIGKKQYFAGAITAAWFLNEFVDDVPWVHLDIAGTAYDVPDISYYGKGATGVGTRLLIELAMNWKAF
ncbi:leucyl aminopeptidase [Candidatus Dependentiae bacterium]|nr:MAG: leucyl aminopeptidase [Candidatus Dependentiae bacterium]